MRQGIAIALIVFGLSACAKPEIHAPAASELSPVTSSVDECYCNVRKRQQVRTRLKKKKQLDYANDTTAPL